jgi:hypothetical protein
VLVKASANRFVWSETIGIDVGLLAAGAAVAIAEGTGTTQAKIGNANIGAPGPVANVTVDAETILTVNADAIAVKAGAVGLAGSVALAKAYPDGTQSVLAEIGGGAVINVTGDISMFSHSDIQAEASALGIAAGAASVGVSVAFVIIAPIETLSINSGASLTAGGGITLRGTNNYSKADGTTKLNRKAKASATAATGGALFAIGVSVSDAEASTNLSVTVGSGAILNATGAISIGASSNDEAESSTKGLSGGTVGLGGSISSARTKGSARADMNGAITSGASLTVTTLASAIANASAFALSFGAVAGNAAVATATVEKNGAGDPTARASLGPGNVTVGGNITITSTLTSWATATTFGVALGAAAGAGASVSNATNNPLVQASITGGNVTSNSGAITLKARMNANEDGSSMGANLGASASATAVSGGLLLGASGAFATATEEGVVLTNVAGGTLSAGGAITLLSTSYADPTADAPALGAGAVGLGASVSNATSKVSTRANMGGSVSAGASLTVSTIATDIADADANALAGGLLGSGNAAYARAAVEKNGSGDATARGFIRIGQCYRRR